MKLTFADGRLCLLAETAIEAWTIGVLSGTIAEEGYHVGSGVDNDGMVHLVVPLQQKPGPRAARREKAAEAASDITAGLPDSNDNGGHLT